MKMQISVVFCALSPRLLLACCWGISALLWQLTLKDYFLLCNDKTNVGVIEPQMFDMEIDFEEQMPDCLELNFSEQLLQC